MSINDYVKSLNKDQLNHCIVQCKIKLEDLENEEKILLWEFIHDNFVEEYFYSFEGVCEFAFKRAKEIATYNKDTHKEYRISRSYFRISEIDELGVNP